MYFKYLIGERFVNSLGTEFKITGYAQDARHREITFSLGDSRIVSTRHISGGNIFSKYDKTLYGVACIGKLDGAAYKHPLYWRWTNMVGRCYNPNHSQYKSYGAKGVYVEEHLLNFSNYAEFVSSLKNYNNLIKNPDKWQIDKDKGGGKCYSRKTIKIITADENLAIENSKKTIPVNMMSPDGTVIRTFESISDAEQKTDIHRGNIARSVRNGGRAGGFLWQASNARGLKSESL